MTTSPENTALTIAMVSLGCAKNLVDAEVMLGVWVKRGYEVIDDLNAATVIVVNTCAFLQCAVEEGIDKILEITSYKERGCCQKLIVAGCMVERYRGKLVKEFPEVDAFVSIDELLQVDKIMGISTDCVDETRESSFLYDHNSPRIVSSGSAFAYLKIADGCNRPCSFCIIPKLRGKFRSRQMSSIVSEAGSMLSAGYKEINLIAQDVTFYGRDLDNAEVNFVALLKNLLKETKQYDYWLRILYTYPTGVSEELIKLIKDEANICDYLDLPLQHISDEVLKAMKRPFGEAKTRELMENVRKWHPQITCRSSFIVGFPGETEADVERLAGFIEDGIFDHVGIFTYSPEEEAASFALGDPVPEKEKQARRDYLMGIQQTVVNKRQGALIGKDEKVLIEGFHPESNLLLVARSARLAPEVDGQIIINDLGESDISPADLIARFATVRHTAVQSYDLISTHV
ncbi:MAG: 30S ribosomal protein S12 methylthiotransferase RimO [Deltaproteobacteria bacterium]|nr:30S ribosomal protein S12 methylthiotransferase RimO [Deltaproteobacteria bacterium]